MIRFIFLLAILSLSGCKSDTDATHKHISYYLSEPSSMRLVEVMSGKNGDERRKIVSQALAAAGIPHRQQPFQTDRLHGENLIVEIGSGSHSVVIATHFDRVFDSPGANDNASCVAAAIGALRELYGKPLSRVKIVFLFSDLEEVALAGSRHYVSVTNPSSILGAISFELCGIGDAVGIWDIREGEANSLVVRALVQASKEQGVYHATLGAVERFSSDHYSFRERNIPSVGVTIVPRDDETKLRAYVDSPNRIIWIIRLLRPKIFQTYHTPGDAPYTLDDAALNLAQNIIVRVVRAIDVLWAPAY